MSQSCSFIQPKKGKLRLLFRLELLSMEITLANLPVLQPCVEALLCNGLALKRAGRISTFRAVNSACLQEKMWYSHHPEDEQSILFETSTPLLSSDKNCPAF